MSTHTASAALPTFAVTMTTTRHGDPEAHRTGCADLNRKVKRGQEEPCELGRFGSRLQVADDWFADLIDQDPDATAESFVGEIHFAPCLDGLRATLASEVTA